MKVKNVYFTVINIYGIDRLVFVREINSFQKYVLRKNTHEYKCIFTGTKYYFSPVDVYNISSILPPELLKEELKRSELLDVYKLNEHTLTENCKTKTKKIGFI